MNSELLVLGVTVQWLIGSAAAINFVAGLVV